MYIDTNLIDDAKRELDGRQRGREGRLARLAAAGAPTDRKGLAKWRSNALDANLEARGGLYHCRTIRIANGADADLPTLGHVGCVISRITIDVELVTHDDGEAYDEPEWLFRNQYGSTSCFFSKSKESAIADCRRQLLYTGDYAETRQAALKLVTQMLHERVNKTA